MRAFDLPEADAHELAQDTFVRFYDAIDHYHGEAEWAFLETVIRNVAYNRVRMLKSASRSAKIVNIDAVRLEQLIISHPEADHLSGFEEASRRMHLHDAIAALPQGQRHTIQLWLDGFHYNDIARVLGIGMDAVKSRLRDARRALRESVNTSSGDSSANDQRTGGGAAR